MTATAADELAAGLQFPRVPWRCPDGSVVVVEILGERVIRVGPDGSVDVVAEVPGGPNGLAVGPEGALYVCNNGGSFTRLERDGLLVPGPFDADRYAAGASNASSATARWATSTPAALDGRCDHPTTS